MKMPTLFLAMVVASFPFLPAAEGVEVKLKCLVCKGESRGDVVSSKELEPCQNVKPGDPKYEEDCKDLTGHIMADGSFSGFVCGVSLDFKGNSGCIIRERGGTRTGCVIEDGTPICYCETDGCNTEYQKVLAENKANNVPNKGKNDYVIDYDETDMNGTPIRTRSTPKSTAALAGSSIWIALGIGTGFLLQILGQDAGVN